jgi:hypothetical protein
MTGNEFDAERARILRNAAADLYRLALNEVDQGRIDNTSKQADELRDKAQEYQVEDVRAYRRLAGLKASVKTSANVELREQILAKLNP